MSTRENPKKRIDWRAEMVKENLWDYSLKSVPVPPVRQMVEEIEQLRAEVDALRPAPEPNSPSPALAGQSAPPEEVTEQMQRAGARALEFWHGTDEDTRIVTEIYNAMRAESIKDREA